MSGRIRIYVEGSTDKAFLDELMTFFSLEKEGVRIIDTVGKDNLKLQKTSLKEYSEQESTGINLIIFDADADPEKRRQEIKDFLGENNFKAEIFLFPNDKEAGDLESLLQSLMIHESFATCWNSYLTCVKGIEKHKGLPGKKAHVYAYREAFMNKNDLKEARRNNEIYLEREDLWKTKAEEEKSLASLLTFLRRHIPSEK